ncbi:hypothetical protein [Microbacterium deminutum]|uniref:DUF4878 domain-containing protein n=1 Tax=Microbacterium deminutum TaxID=344164 RepID=A0ABP5CBA4_9MICO
MKRGVVIAIVAAAALVVAGGATAAWLLTRPPSAEAVADAYLRALSEGDFATIQGLVGGGDSDGRQLESAFSGASGHISDYSVRLSGESDAARTARADVELGGEKAVVTFSLTQQDGRWKVADYLASLEVKTTMGDSARVGGVLVPAGEPVPLLPAVYPVTAAPQGLLVGDASAIVTNQEPVSVSLAPTLSPGAGELAQQRLDAYADDCAKPAPTVPGNCGLRVPWAADLASLDSIAFRIDTYPVVALAQDGHSFDALGGRIVATATGTTRAGAPGSFTYETDEWALRGTVTFQGDEMVLAVR